MASTTEPSQAPTEESAQRGRMSGRFWGILSALGALIAAGLIIGAAMVDRDGLFGQLPAAWLQAVGSIAAIIGAIWIAGEQARRDARRKAVDEAEREHRRMLEALEGVTMLIQIGGQARATADLLSVQLSSRSSLQVDFLRIYVSVFQGMRDDVDKLLSIVSQSSGIRLVVFNFRAGIGHIAFALRTAVTGIDLGHSAGTKDFETIRIGIAEGVKILDQNLEMAKVMQQVWLEAKQKEDEKRGVARQSAVKAGK